MVSRNKKIFSFKHRLTLSYLRSLGKRRREAPRMRATQINQLARQRETKRYSDSESGIEFWMTLSRLNSNDVELELCGSGNNSALTRCIILVLDSSEQKVKYGNASNYG